MTFTISPLSPATFAPLFSMSDAELAAHGAVRRIADRHPGFPCRVALRDAEVGETLILVHYEHQPAATPFRASHAIYVGQSARPADLAPGEVPDMLRTRLLSVRAFDAAHMLVAADVTEGSALEAAIERLLVATASYLHVHFAKQGCYAARVDRA